ncbi:twitching motility protein PilT [Candidatus Poriferisodalis sp.]|uniref:twitching motility protein PilT n=1 Tax=Candidatus Poriferisodalis sp. TaxID=3101277 RepID=UPI003B51E518
MTISVLDSGALIALERDDRDMWALVKPQNGEAVNFQVPAGVLVEVCRDRSSQALLNVALKRCRTVPLSEEIAQLAGLLLAISDASGAVDATVMATAVVATNFEDVEIYTSDSGDISDLKAAAELIPGLVKNDIAIRAT